MLSLYVFLCTSFIAGAVDGLPFHRPGNNETEYGFDLLTEIIAKETLTSDHVAKPLGKSMICEVAPTFHSRRVTASDPKKTIFFVNGYTKKVGLFWLDYDGVEKKFGDMKPSTLYLMHTFGGHGFLVKSSDTNEVITVEQECLTVADYNDQQYVVIGRHSCSDVKYTSVTSSPEVKVYLNFINLYPADVTMYWLDFEGKEKRYATVHPGATARQHTRSGHGWIAKSHASVSGLSSGSDHVVLNNTCVYVANNDAEQTVIVGGSA